MFERRKSALEVRAALREADALMPPSGDVEDLLNSLSKSRGRPMRLLGSPLGSTVSGLLISTESADYVVVASDASPERLCAIVCHEVAHALLGHSHESSGASALFESGMIQGIDPELAHSVVAARDAYAESSESDAETVATYISIELRRRVMRGGHTYYDELWR